MILKGGLAGGEMVPWTFCCWFAQAIPRFKSLRSLPGFPSNPAHSGQPVVIFVLSVIFLKHVPFPALYTWCTSERISWDFPGGPVKTPTSDSGGTGSIPAQGTKILHASEYSENKQMKTRKASLSLLKKMPCFFFFSAKITAPKRKEAVVVP